MRETGYSISRLQGDAAIDEVARLEATSFTNPWPRDVLARELQNGDVARGYILRTDGGELVAFCICWFIVDELHINTVAVKESERRRGLATRLLRFVFKEAQAAGINRATLEVRRSNEAALKLYEHLGFEVRAVRRKYYSHPVEDALILWSQKLGFLDPDSEP